MTDLAEEYIKVIGKKERITWDEFFDKHKIPKGARSDFVIRSILKQALERTEGAK